MSKPLVIFKVIHDETQKQMLLQKVLSANETLFLRDKLDNNFPLKPIGVNSNSQLKCQFMDEFITASNLKIQTGDTFTASFALNDEKYIFEARPVVQNNYITLTILNLFHLQRRRNFRYVLPTDYSAKFILNSLNEAACSLNGLLLDLSTEGCAVKIPQEETSLSLEDIVSAKIFLGDRNPISIQGTIKNIRVKDETSFVLGIEFNHVASTSEEKIVNCLTDLQREIYLRKAG